MQLLIVVLQNMLQYLKKRVKIPDDMDWELASSLPVTSLTPHHALKETCLKLNEYLLVFGASSNAGMVAVQLSKRMEQRSLQFPKMNG